MALTHYSCMTEFTMQFLHAADATFALAHRADRGDYARRRRKRRDKRHLVVDRRPADLVFGDTRDLTRRRIDHDMHVEILDRIDNVWAALAHLSNDIGRKVSEGR